MNIYDIAKKSGVSIATVSRVINNKGHVGEKTRLKVQQVLNEESYRPNAIAKGLVSNSMKTIAVYVQDIRDYHLAREFYIVEQEFSAKGYNVILCNTGYSLDKTVEYIRLLTERQVDGLIFLGSIFDKYLSDTEIQKAIGNVPVVLANGQSKLNNSNSVMIDDSLGIQKIVRYLDKKGHKNIAYFQDADTNAAISKANGFIKGMHEIGSHNPEKHMYVCSAGFQGGLESVAKIMSSHTRYTACVYGEDIVALGALKELTRLGFQVPNDMAITGYNNSVFAQCSVINLTTVENKGEELGLRCAEVLEKMIIKSGNVDSMVIEPEIVIGDSA